MKSEFLLIVLTAALSLASCGVADQDQGGKESAAESATASEKADNEVVIGTRHTMWSEVMQEERPYWVSLPRDYDPERKYPYLYLLDGPGHFGYVAGTLHRMGAPRCPNSYWSDCRIQTGPAI